MSIGRKAAFSVASAGASLGIFVLVIGCSAATEDPVFGTRLPDIGTETESPTLISTVPTLTPTPSRDYVATPVVAQPTTQAVNTPTPIPTPTAIPTEVPTPTPVRLTVGDSGMTDEELERARQQMLDLINAGRLAAELDAVVLDDNPSAQLHANDMRENCFLSQWGSDGSKATLRYNMEGGIHAIYDYTSGSSFCPSDPNRYRWDSIAEKVSEAYGELSDRFGQRKFTYRKVGIGLSYRRPNLWLSLVFATDFLRYIDEPKFKDGVLTLAYELTHNAVAGDDLIDLVVHYDPPLKRLDRGQLSRTADSGLGQRIATIRPTPDTDFSYPDEEYSINVSACPDPYEIEDGAAPPTSYENDSALSLEATSKCRAETRNEIVKWVTSSIERHRSGVRVKSDLQDLVSQFGAGVYTLQVWAEVDSQSVPVSEYSIIVE